MEGHRPGLTVGDAHPLAQDTVVLGAEAHRDLERAGGVDEEDVCLTADHPDVLHPEAGGRGAVAVGDPQRRRPGRFLVVGRIRQGIQRQGHPGRQPQHMGVDVRPEPCLTQPPVVVDEEAVAGAPGRHHDAGHRTTVAHRTTIAERRHSAKLRRRDGWLR